MLRALDFNGKSNRGRRGNVLTNVVLVFALLAVAAIAVFQGIELWKYIGN